MPHFSDCCGRDEYVCQVCGAILCSSCHPSEWRPDITGSKSAGNVCPTCLVKAVPAVAKSKITKTAKLSFLRDKLASDGTWALRALAPIFSRQTADEQAAEITSEHNSVGFSGVDAELLSSFAKQFQARNFLTEKQMTYLFKKIPKYAGQVLGACDESKLLAAMGK